MSGNGRWRVPLLGGRLLHAYAPLNTADFQGVVVREYKEAKQAGITDGYYYRRAGLMLRSRHPPNSLRCLHASVPDMAVARSVVAGFFGNPFTSSLLFLITFGFFFSFQYFLCRALLFLSTKTSASRGEIMNNSAVKHVIGVIYNFPRNLSRGERNACGVGCE